MTHAATQLLIVAIAWGAFAFGAVYPWAYWPLAVAAVAVAILSVVPKWANLTKPAAPAPPSLHLSPLVFALALLGLAVALQLARVPAESLRMLSPPTLDVVTTFELAAGARPDRHAASIAPHLTATALALFASFALLVVGSAHLFTTRGPRGIAQAIAIIAVLLAMTAIIQKPLFTGKIYGFWTPLQGGGGSSGPFVNRNHFAGWMMMALPLTLGLLCGGIARGMRHVKPAFHDRMVWLMSPDASRLALLAGAVAVMALSIVMTLSRSGIVATLFALALIGVVAVRRQVGATRRTIVTGYVLALAVAVTAWVGMDTIGRRFAGADWSDFNDRRGPWADAAAIASTYPLVGTGLNTYGVAMLFYQRHDIEHHYSAAHNDYLQLAAEGGLLLTVPAALCVVALGVTVWKRFKEETSTSGYWIRVGAVTGLLAIALQETVDFSLQIPGNAALFAVLCGIALHGSPERTTR